jgi:hypothetical protein
VSEPKPFASLSSGLLARKGAARPAMRPQGFGQGGAGLDDLGWNDMGFDPPKAAPAERDSDHDAFGEDIFEHPRASHPTGLTPVESPVHSQQAQIADSFSAGPEADEEEFDDTAEIEEAFEPAPIAEQIAPRVHAAPVTEGPSAPIKIAAAKSTPRPRSAAGSKGKAAFTLRLDPDRHLKLRLSCAVRGRSAQQIVTDALDHLLATMPELDAMAEKANRKG